MLTTRICSSTCQTPTGRPAHRARDAKLVAAVTLMTFAPLAVANVYQGGPWNLASSWSDGFVPNLTTHAEFRPTHTGVVQIGNGAMADVLEFTNGATGYRIRGGPTAILTLRQVSNGGPNNAIEAAFLRGVLTDNEHGVLIINSGSTFYGELDRLRVTSTILDADNGGDPEVDPPAATDVYANGTYTGTFFHTGSTTLYGATRLSGNNARIVASEVIRFSGGPVLLDSTNGSDDDRISDTATVTLEAAEFHLIGSGVMGEVDETIGRLHVAGGANGLGLLGDATLSFGDGPGALVRDNVSRGTLRINDTSGLKLSPATMLPDDMVPYAVINNGGLHAPARYDSGDDEQIGTDDDGGLSAVTTETFAAAVLSGGHAAVSSPATVDAAGRSVRSLSLNGNDLDLGIHGLRVESGVIAVSFLGTGTNAIRGTGPLTAAAGNELFIYNANQQTEVAAPLAGDNGLTITNLGGFSYQLQAGNRVILSGVNTYAGPTTVNSGELVLRGDRSLPAGSALRLSHAGVNFDYVPIRPVSGRVFFDGESASPDGGRNNFIRDIRLKDGQTFNFSGGIEGRGAYFIRGTNVTMRVTTPLGTEATAAGAFSLWPEPTTTLRVDGQLGDPILSPGTVIQFGGSTVGSGYITGGMQLSDGVLAPGSDGAAGTAVLRIRSLSMFGGEARFHINGTARGAAYDGIDLNENLFVGPDTKFVLEPGTFVGQLGQRFELIRYSSFGGFGTRPAFATSLATVAGAQWVQIYGPTAYEVAVAGPTGDSNLDGRVNFDDLLALAQNYGGSGSWLNGDFNNDGKITFDDLLALAQRYGSGVAVTSSGLSADGMMLDAFSADWALARSLVPEPTAASLVVVSAYAIGRRRQFTPRG